MAPPKISFIFASNPTVSLTIFDPRNDLDTSFLTSGDIGKPIVRVNTNEIKMRASPREGNIARNLLNVEFQCFWGIFDNTIFEIKKLKRNSANTAVTKKPMALAKECDKEK